MPNDVSLYVGIVRPGGALALPVSQIPQNRELGCLCLGHTVLP